ncbi:ABC transporter permease [Alkaliphilus crotonatoxidans]
MLTLVKNNLKLFFKNKYLLSGFIIFFIIINAYLIEGLYKLSIHRDAFYYLQVSQKLSMVYFIFFIFISYEYLVKSKNDFILESLSITDNGKLTLYFSKFVVLLAIMVTMTLNIMLYNYISYIAMHVQALSFAYHIFLNNILNIFLVSFLGSCIGTMVSLYLKRFQAYLLMILSGILISPIFEFVPFVLFMGFGKNIYPFREVFNILPPNLNWVEEALYGLSIEAYRWNLVVFWICLLSSAILLKLKTKKHKLQSLVCMLLVMVSVVNFYLYTNPGSIVKKDYNPKGYTPFDELYYTNDVQKEEKVDFSITAYNMKLVIDRQLHNDVKIQLNEKEPLESYKFTLYRNFEVKSILNKENKNMEYKRDGDYLEIFNPTSEKLEEIRIIYSGYSPVFYSNSQGVLLPGSFPYYPMEGYKRLYIKEQTVFIPIIRDDEVDFEVDVKSKLNLYSNLNKDGNYFSGKAQAITMVGGFVEEEKVGDVTLYGLILSEMDKANLLKIDDLLKPYKHLVSGIDTLNITDKKIFQAPHTFSSRVLENGLISFNDHVFVYSLDEKTLIYTLMQSIIPQDYNKSKIKTVLLDYIIDKDRFLNIPKEQLENFKPYEFHNLFLKKIDELGEDYVIQATFSYLKDKNDGRDSITFIENLNSGGH